MITTIAVRGVDELTDEEFAARFGGICLNGSALVKLLTRAADNAEDKKHKGRESYPPPCALNVNSRKVRE